MREDDALFVRVCFPMDFEDSVKSKGRYDLMRLYKKGIVVSLNEITTSEEHSEELLTAVRMELGCHPMTPHKIMLFDVEEFKDKTELWFDFIKDKGEFGENYPFRLFWFIRNIQAGSIIFSEQLNKEYDKEGDDKLGVWRIKRHTREYGVEDGKKVFLHTTLLTAHAYLIEEPFYSDIEKADYKHLWDAIHGIKKKTIKQARDPISTSLRHEVFKKDNYKCKECGRTNKETILHIDHIIPVTQKGTDELSNLQTLCSECNLHKKDRAWVGGEVKHE